MNVYSGKESQHVSPSMTNNDATVTRLNPRTESVGHKPYMYNRLSELSDDLIPQQRTAGPNAKAMPDSTGQKMELKQTDIQTRVGIT
jgi:hypothetical protein